MSPSHLLQLISWLLVISVLMAGQVSGSPDGIQNGQDLVEKGLNSLSISNYQDALSAFSRATRVNPENDIAWTGKGFALYGLGRHDEAVVAFDKALELNPANREARTGKVESTSELLSSESKQTSRQMDASFPSPPVWADWAERMINAVRKGSWS